MIPLWLRVAYVLAGVVLGSTLLGLLGILGWMVVGFLKFIGLAPQ